MRSWGEGEVALSLSLIHIFNGERTLRKVKLKCRILDIDCIYPVLGQRNIDRLPHARDRDHGRTVIVIRVLGNGKLQDRVAENVVAPDIRDPIPAAVGKRDGQFRNVRMQFDLDVYKRQDPYPARRASPTA